MRRLNLNAYRYSIAWPRIQPNGSGPVNQKGLDHYKRVTDAILEANVRPLVTLYHWDIPQALVDKGGWANRDMVARFTEYAGIMASPVAGRCERSRAPSTHSATGARPRHAAHRVSATALESSLCAGVSRILTVTKKVGVGHDWLCWVVRLAMRHVVVIVGNAHHETGGLNRPAPQHLDLCHCQAPTAAPEVPPISIAVPFGVLNALRISKKAWITTVSTIVTAKAASVAST